MKKNCLVLILTCQVLGAWVLSEQNSTGASEEVQVNEWADLSRKADESGRPWLPFLDVPTMHMGVYVLAAGAKDGQGPHDQDEVYYVVEGRARLRAGDHDQEVGPGSIIFVKAHVEHSFHEITEDLRVLVFFSKAPPAPPRPRSSLHKK